MKDCIKSQHFAGILEGLIMALVDQAFDRLVERLEARLNPAPPPDLPSLGLEPLKTYTAKEAAAFLGIERLSSVYEIPEDELRRVRRVGSSVGYLGLDLVCYKLGLEPLDLPGIVERYRRQLLDERPAVRPMRPDQKTRIL